MKINVIVEHYPAPFKPYFDTQFADFVAHGHELRIFTMGEIDTRLNERVVDHGLDSYTRWYPSSGHDVAHNPLKVIREGYRAFPSLLRFQALASGKTIFKRVGEIARMLIIASHDADVVLVHGLIPATLFPWVRRVSPRCRVAMYYHGGELVNMRPILLEVSKAAFEGVDVVFTNTDFSRRHAISRGCPPDKVKILPVGFSLSDYPEEKRQGYRPGGVLRLLSAGRLSPEKGAIFALRAIRLLLDRGITNIQYSLTGNGPVEAELKEFVRENRLEAYVRFLGSLSTEEVIEEMSRADILLQPSIQVGNWVENQACAVQEAMLMRAVPVISESGGMPESIPEGVKDYMVPPGDAVALADQIERIASLSGRDLAALGEAGREFVLSNYDIRRLNEAMLRALEGIR